MAVSRARIALGDIDKEIGDDKAMQRRVRVALGEIDKTNSAVGFDISDDVMDGGVLIDSSGSMSPWYGDGTVQVSAERVLGYYGPLDRTMSCECAYFDDVARRTDNISLKNRAYVGFVNRTKPARLGGTNLYDALLMGVEMAAEALKDKRILDVVKTSKGGMFSRSQRGEWVTPTSELKPLANSKFYHLTIITDGAPTVGITDPYVIMELIVRLSYVGIFIKFVYVGNDRHGELFLEQLDDMKTMKHNNDLADPSDPDDPRHEDVDPQTQRGQLPLRYIDNVDKVKLGDPRLASDEDVADAMNNELPTYLRSAKNRGLLVGV